MIIPIQHKVDWELICQLKQAQINKYNTRKNEQRVEDNYKVRDKVMLNKHTKYKYETPYMDPFVITRCWTNGTVSLKMGVREIRHDICGIIPYKSDTRVEDISSKNMSDNVNI